MKLKMRKWRFFLSTIYSTFLHILPSYTFYLLTHSISAYTLPLYIFCPCISSASIYYYFTCLSWLLRNQTKKTRFHCISRLSLWFSYVRRSTPQTGSRLCRASCFSFCNASAWPRIHDGGVRRRTSRPRTENCGARSRYRGGPSANHQMFTVSLILHISHIFYYLSNISPLVDIKLSQLDRSRLAWGNCTVFVGLSDQ